MERNLKTMFEHAIEIELMAANIYRMYHKMFEHDPIVAALWNSLAEDEISHAEILKKTFETIPASDLQTNPGQLMWQNITIVKKTLEKQIRAKVDSLDSALEIAHQMESSEINAIFEFLTLKYIDKPIRDSFVESEIMEHQKKLVDFSMTYSSKSLRKTITPRL